MWGVLRKVTQGTVGETRRNKNKPIQNQTKQNERNTTKLNETVSLYRALKKTNPVMIHNIRKFIRTWSKNDLKSCQKMCSKMTRKHFSSTQPQHTQTGQFNSTQLNLTQLKIHSTRNQLQLNSAQRNSKSAQLD